LNAVIERAQRAQRSFMSSLPGRVVLVFTEKQAPNWAVLLAWNLLFAMIPIALLLIALLGFVLHFAGVTQKVLYTDIVGVMPSASARGEVLKALQGARQNTGIFFVLGLVGFVWSGASLFSTMDQAFAAMFGVPPRDMVRQKLMSIGMMLLFVVFVGLTLVTSSALPLLQYIPLLPDVLKGGGSVVLQALLGLLAGVLLFGSIYFVVPNKPQRLSQVWLGALLAGLLFELLTFLFPIYLHFTGGGSTYGPLFGLFFLLMTYAYFLGLITMFGAALNAVVENRPAYSGATEGVEEQTRAAGTATVTEVREPRQPWRSILVLLGLVFGALLAGKRSRRGAA
jgi:membrane protein